MGKAPTPVDTFQTSSGMCAMYKKTLLEMPLFVPDVRHGVKGAQA